MITLNIDGLMNARKLVRAKKKEVIDKANFQYRQHVLAMYRDTLAVSPQFSGDFVGNWDIETTNSPQRPYAQVPNKGSVAASQQPRHAGQEDGPYKSSLMRGIGRLRYIQYGDPVYFVNSAPIQIDSPEVIGPAGDRKDLRETVVITAWESISSYLQAKWGNRP